MDIVVVRKCKDGKRHYSNSAPCAYCLDYLKFLGIRNIIFSNADGELEIHKVNSFTKTYITRSQKIEEKSLKMIR